MPRPGGRHGGMIEPFPNSRRSPWISLRVAKVIIQCPCRVQNIDSFPVNVHQSIRLLKLRTRIPPRSLAIARRRATRLYSTIRVKKRISRDRNGHARSWRASFRHVATYREIADQPTTIACRPDCISLLILALARWYRPDHSSRFKTTRETRLAARICLRKEL